MDILYREFINSDIDELVKVYMNAFNNEPWNDEWTKKTAKERLLDLINDKNSRILVGVNYYGTILGAIIGRKEVFYDGFHFQIIELFVDFNYKGLGIGTELLRNMEYYLKKEQIKRIYLLTLRTNDTIKFYEKNKFKEANNIVVMDKLNIY